MPTHHDEIEKDQYEKLNALAARVEGLTSAVDVSNDILVKQLEQSAADYAAAMEEMKSMHESYVTMTKYIIGILSVVIFSLIGAIIYGAIGRQGLFAVRDSMPKVALAIPWHNDLDRFYQRRNVAA